MISRQTEAVTGEEKRHKTNPQENVEKGTQEFTDIYVTSKPQENIIPPVTLL